MISAGYPEAWQDETAVAAGGQPADEPAYDYDSAIDEELAPYRALSKSAVASVVLDVLGLLGLLFPPALVFAAGGLLAGLVSLRALRRYPDELAGRGLAWSGVVFSLLLAVGGGALHAIAYATEVPPGYERVSFEVLKADPGQPDRPPPEALELDGRRVFIKGYVYPDGQQENIQHFVLVSDLGTCCFGGQPKLTHMIEVTLRDPLRARYALRKRGLGGVLRVRATKKPLSGLDGVYYELDADYLK